MHDMGSSVLELYCYTRTHDMTPPFGPGPGCHCLKVYKNAEEQYIQYIY